ncbi:GNAT family N-acetyltransferase [Ferrimonas sediminicola]|uniref:GNAT family N-acetyltransferase n=1 Tax=Ferrimonas sediminicola TaxID=2569538 RepID=A0A4U1BIV2_9GAMM|nr:GNAT family N-acetyltransferase [Ferrimonas sediminicola]TKB51055.1 GNAT family N-acetyltransferase [Ferrimonas sediminicola]
MNWREGTIDEVMALVAQVPELDTPYPREEYDKRLGGAAHLIQIAELEGKAAGFKVGYALNEQEFYSWLGAVLPQFRGQGVAKTLLRAQEEWAQTQGYGLIKVKSRNRYPEMLRMLLGKGYHLVDMQKASDTPLDYRILLEKSL